MKKKNKYLLVGLVFISLLGLAGCQKADIWFKNFKQSFTGLSMQVRTFDEDSQVIDQLSGKSVSIERDKDFDTTDNDGNSKKDSSVIQVTIGRNQLTHVGSSMIVSEKGLDDIFTKYSKTVNITDSDRNLPLVNKMVHDFKNDFTGSNKVILIRSQNGTPLATYAGKKVSTFKTDVPKSTGLLVDGKYLFIYHCDYTIYDTELLENE